MSIGTAPNVAGGLGPGEAPGGDAAPDCGTVPSGSEPPTGVAPVGPPGPGSPYSQAVGLRTLAQWWHGLSIRCLDTGAVLAAECWTVTFYHDTPGVKHYETVPGVGTQCAGPYQSHEWGVNTGQGDVSGSVDIWLTN